MTNVRRLGAKDIGGGVFALITRGLYRYSLDALREYIQNSIDANASQVKITINRDLVAVEDNGAGMGYDTAANAMKLGISLKNPAYDIGFRGIGIYSSFDICDELEIHTKASGSSSAYSIRFQFGTMKKLLAKDEAKKKKGLRTTLYLEQ